MMKSSRVVCLACDADETLRRMNWADNDRPLLDVADPRAEVERLLEARREAYTAIPWQVDTTGLSVEEVAIQVVEIARVPDVNVRAERAKPYGLESSPEGASPFQHGGSAPCNADIITLHVRYPGGEYPIHIGDGLLAHVGGALRATGVPEGSRVAVVSNPVVAPLYGAQVEAALRSVGFRPFACSIPDGEQHKRLTTVAALYDQFLAGGLDRSGTVLSLGGGVTGDVAGFAAASFMRGVRFAQVPTTLLAMVDASVGGKTGVDLPQGKNLVGAFKQPALVVIDPTVLVTLPAEEIRSGLAEVIKHGLIGAPDLFVELERRGRDRGTREQGDQAARIARSLRVKIAIVEQDPFEQGRRAVLNLGHTVGHALEKLSGFALRHGEAVSIGMVAAARIAAELDQAAPSLAGRIEAVLSAWGLPVQCPPFDADAIWEAMAHDKKRRGQSLRWVLPRAIGEVEITEDVPPQVIKSVLCNLAHISHPMVSNGCANLLASLASPRHRKHD